MTNPFVWLLLVGNLGASGVFLWQREWAWSLVYFGAGLIQIGCLWAKR